MAILSPAPKLQFFDANGNPLVGGKLYSYTAGTTSPLATYTDSTNTSVNTNPIILDSRGEASVWLGASAYKLVLYSATDVLIWSVDNVTAASSDTVANLAASTGSSLIGYIQGGTGSVAMTVQTKLRQSVNVKDFGAVGDGVTNDTAAFVSAATAANVAGLPLRVEGTFAISSLSLTSPLEIIGKGSITKIASTLGNLISSTSDLTIRGQITLDQNAANNVNPSATATSDCTINHTGGTLILDGVKFNPSVSVNIRSSATSKLWINNCEINSGWMCIYAPVGTACSVQITGGKFYNATKDDNIQVFNALNVWIDGIESYGAFRSGIVVSNAAERARISNCYCHDNKIDTVANQGGWGIVCSVSVARTTLTGNVCVNNERGPVTIDTYTITSATDAHITITGNILDGDYNGNYCTTGLGINGARFVTVSGNRIRRAAQHILAVDTRITNIIGNTFDDCGAGYFIQVTNSGTTAEKINISNNLMNSCTTASGGVINVLNADNVRVNDNQITALTGVGRSAFRFTSVTNFSIDGNTIEKTDTGTGYMVWLVGTLTNGRISRNKFRSATTAWQYYIVATGATLTDIATEWNEIVVPSVQTNPNRYILNGAAIISDGDTINGVRDYYNVAPTFCAVRQGQTAGIAGVLRMWNGSAWV